MNTASQIIERVFSLDGQEEMEELALDVFRFQHDNNKVYRQYCDLLGCVPNEVDNLDAIPYLPVALFKSHRVVSFTGNESFCFRSSGTSGTKPSCHYVLDMDVYERSFLTGFQQFYGPPSDYCILALLPGYLERKDSSLVRMANRFVMESGHPESGFYLHDLEGLASLLHGLMNHGEKVLLLGVTHALLDFAEKHPMSLRGSIVMETGGMKGRRREMVRDELHRLLCQAFDQQGIHAEYGMTELFSQAYSRGNGRFNCPPWMQVLLRDPNDPLQVSRTPGSGGINVVDLANVWSCSFLATDDLGRLHPDGSFEVLGRFDHSEMRGCNLMVE